MVTALKYWWHRRQKGYPCKDEIAECVLNLESLTTRKAMFVDLYLDEGNTIEDVGMAMSVTRERVRQVLMNIYYRSNHKDD